MRRGLVVTVVAVLGSIVAAPSALAAPEGGMGCPQGYVVFDRSPSDGGPPTYAQGDAVTASGVITNTEAGVRSVTLRAGAGDGPVLGEAAVDEHGSWSGLSFAIPQEAADGAFVVVLEARDRDGVMLPGLPYPFELRVGPPPAAQAATPAPAERSAAEPAKRQAPKAVRKAAPAPKAVRGPAPAPKARAVTSAARPVPAGTAAAAAAPAVEAAAPKRTRKAPRRTARAVEPAATDGASGDGVRQRAAASAAASSAAGPSGRTRSTSARAERPRRASAPVLPAVLGGCLLVLVGFAAGRFARDRRRLEAAPVLAAPTSEPPAPVAVAVPDPPADDLEVELQALLAQEAAHSATGAPPAPVA